jgi:hypothetical protein
MIFQPEIEYNVSVQVCHYLDLDNSRFWGA